MLKYMMFFYFLKIIFNISTSKRFKKYKPHLILTKKILNSIKTRLNHRAKQKNFKFNKNQIEPHSQTKAKRDLDRIRW